jgi:predicted permease
MILDSVRQDLRLAVRALRSRPGFAAGVVLTIGLGMGANAAMFGIIDRLLFRGPDQIRDPNSVVLIQTHRSGARFSNSSFSYAAYTDYRSTPGGFSAVAVSWTRRSFPLGRGREATQVVGALVSAGFFPLLGARPALGRFFTTGEDDEHNPIKVAVIGYGLWQQRFGGHDDVLGQMLDIGIDRYRIVGVAMKGFSGIDLSTVDVWLPVSAAAGLRFDSSPTWTTNRGNTWLTIVARIRPGVSAWSAAEQATAVHRASLRRRLEAEPKAAKFIRPDSESVVLAPIIPGKAPAGVRGTVAPNDLQVSKLLGIVALIVLVITCANVANLLLVRGFGRGREIAVRLALGVSRWRLISQLLIEALVLAALGGVGALLIAHWTSHGVRRLLLGDDAWTAAPVDARLIAFTGAMTIVTALVTSLVPAAAAVNTDVARTLKAGAREGGGRHSPIRTALLIVQASLAVVLLAGAGLFLRSVENVGTLPLGIDVPHTLVADVNHKAAGLSTSEVHRLFDQFVVDVSRVPGVSAAAVSIGLPFGLNWGTELIVPGRPTPKSEQNPAQYAVTPKYFEALGIPVVAGRAFAPTDRQGTSPVVIISQRTAQLYFPQQNAVGQCVKVGADTMPCATIVGVVGSTIKQGLEDIVPQVYRPLDQLPESYTESTVSFFGYSLVVHTTADASRFVELVRRAMQNAIPSAPYANVRPMRDLLGSRIRAWELGAKVFSALGVLALVLASVGLYSVLAFSIAQRQHELSVRVALGAQSLHLVRLTVGKGLAPIIAGIVAGIVLTLVSSKLVEALLFKVSPRDPSVLGGACLVLLGSAAVASLVPAFRATRVDPASVLRTE